MPTSNNKFKRKRGHNKEGFEASSENSSPETSQKKKVSKKGPNPVGLTLPPSLIEADSSAAASIEEELDPEMPSNAELSKALTEAKTELEFLKKELSEERAKNAANDLELKDLKKTNEDILKKLNDLEKATSFSEQNFVTYFHKAMVAWENDKKEEDEKKPNFVIYGCPLSKTHDNTDFPDGMDQNAVDLDLVKLIVTESGHDSSTIKEVFRMGKGKLRDGTDSRFPPLIKVKTTSEDVQKAVLRNQKDVLAEIPVMSAHRGAFSQYIRPDLTFSQRRLHAELVQKRNKKNEDIPDDQPKWKVFNFNLVPPQGNARRN